MTDIRRKVQWLTALSATGLALVLSTLTAAQPTRRPVIMGPNVGPSPYTVVRWIQT